MKPWLLLPPKLAHDLAPVAIRLLAEIYQSPNSEWSPRRWKGLSFRNPLGLAGGVDKDGSMIEDWWALGAGFVEIGTVTPEPQGPNDGTILGRNRELRALWNRMGFPGSGSKTVCENLRDLPQIRPTPIFVNVGKNRTTPNEMAARDYESCFKSFANLADAFVINISSPNTKGLRDLLEPENLKTFLRDVMTARTRVAGSKPTLLKISPDLSDDEVRQAVLISLDLGIDGFIATNTTLHRDAGSPFPAEGGVSGLPLAMRAKQVLKIIVSEVGHEQNQRQETLIVSVGGVLTPEDVFERLEMGADLVQVYSALTFSGPLFFDQVARCATTLRT